MCGLPWDSSKILIYQPGETAEVKIGEVGRWVSGSSMPNSRGFIKILYKDQPIKGVEKSMENQYVTPKKLRFAR